MYWRAFDMSKMLFVIGIFEHAQEPKHIMCFSTGFLTSNSIPISPGLRMTFSVLHKVLEQYRSQIEVVFSGRASEIKQFKDEVYPPPTL